MKAMVLRGPRKLVPAEVERPVLGPGQVLVRVTHSGVCGTDLHIYEGAILVRHPLIMGHEMIEARWSMEETPRFTSAIASSLTRQFIVACASIAAPAKRISVPTVLSSGAIPIMASADYLVAPRSHVYLFPDSINSEVAPLIQPVTTCVHGQQRIKVFPGQSVAVIGLGVTGQVHVQVAKAWERIP